MVSAFQRVIENKNGLHLRFISKLKDIIDLQNSRAKTHSILPMTEAICRIVFTETCSICKYVLRLLSLNRY